MSDYVTAIRTSDGDKKIDYNALVNKPKSIQTTATITTTWSGTAVPYEQTILIPEVLPDSVIDISLPSTATQEQVEAYQALNPQDGGQTTGSITIRAFGEVNTIEIPINVVIAGV